MKYFDIQGTKVSRLGYGCMRFPVIDGDNSKIDEAKAAELLKRAINNGVNYIDTAYNYHGKMSESFVGKFVEENSLRDEVLLTTKLPAWLVEKTEDFERLMEEQLSNLRTDHIDFYLLHSLDIKTFRKIVDLGVFDFIKKAKASGKVRHMGFSFHDEFPAFEEMVNSFPWDFCQIQLNYLDVDYQAGQKGYELATKLGIPVVIMEPLKGGRLSNPPKEIRELSDEFKPLTPSQVALKYPLNLPNVMTVLSGMSAKEQVDENIEMASSVEPNSVTEKEKEFFSKACEFFKAKEQIGCTACEYCMPCTVEINIPKVFSLWNNAFIFDEEEKSKKAYADYLKDRKTAADACIACGKCEGLCPQNLEIIEGLQKAHDFLTEE